MATTRSKNVIPLKLLIDTKEKRVLFAEAGKDFTDFLFSLLSMPVGTIIRLLSTKGMVGTLGKLYQSLENLSETYIQTNVDKDILLKPKSSALGQSSTHLLLTNEDTTSHVKVFYSCGKTFGSNYYSSSTCPCHNKYVSDDPTTICPSCGSLVNKVLTFVPPPKYAKVGGSSSSGAEVEGGFVKGVVTYMIMDDLEVKPMSTISSIAMLNTFNVKEVGALQEKTVSVGINEGLKLLKASLQTKMVLTDVFLKK
ncbi:uncharacterized protein LOC115724041 [Cannabis sativa]|uniref:uncharacterized protein LOC115724041 n=1 Tax=Cannabis sativa TaxID=3483 RepID=UPI0029C9BE1E|nr:uncharacterized protein LOC115724041 [Cannabis sativa]